MTFVRVPHIIAVMARRGEADKALKYGLISALIFSCAFYIISFLFTPEIVSVFNGENNARLAELAVSGFRIYFTSIFFSGINILCASYFSSTDRPKISLLLSVLRGVALVVPLSLLLAFLFKMYGVWLSLTVCEAAVSVVAFVMLKRYNAVLPSRGNASGENRI